MADGGSCAPDDVREAGGSSPLARPFPAPVPLEERLARLGTSARLGLLQKLMVLGRGSVVLPYAWLLAFGAALGALMRRLQRKRWRKARRQLTRCFPELDGPALSRLVAANARSYGMGVMERAMAWWWPAKRLRPLLKKVEGLPNLQEAQRDGRGILLLMMHTTSLDMGASLLRLVCDIDFTYQPARNPVIDRAQLEGRRRGEIRPPGVDRVETQAIDAAEVRTVIRRLRQGRIVWFAPDRDFGPRKSHVFAPFFGLPAATITATSRYARLSSARVVPVDTWREPGGGYGLRFGAPLADFPGASELEDCTRLNACVEAAVRAHPEQYRWTHMRFKTRPTTVSQPGSV